MPQLKSSVHFLETMKLSNECSFCEASFSTKKGLKSHEDNHKEIKFLCRDCGQQFTRKCNLTIYINSIHKGKKFKCDQCEKEFTCQGNRGSHIKSVHEQKRYACTMCDYQTTYQSSVKIHTEAIHEGLRYSCDICGCKSSSKSNLIMHIKTKHEEKNLNVKIVTRNTVVLEVFTIIPNQYMKV